MNMLAKLAPRHGFERYGGDVYFSDPYTPSHLIASEGKTFYPNDPEWDKEITRWKASVFVWNSVPDHLIKCHMLISSPIAISSRYSLSPDHPLRRFLTPYVFRSMYVSRAGLDTIFGKFGLAHRATGSIHSGIVDLAVEAIKSYDLKTFPEIIKDNGLEELAKDREAYAYGYDGLKFSRVIERYIKSYIGHYWDEDTIQHDAELNDFWDSLKRYGILYRENVGQLSVESLSRVLNYFLFNVTVAHDQLGARLLDSWYAGEYPPSAIYPGTPAVTAKANARKAMFILSLTGFDMPCLMDDYSHLFLDEKAREIFQEFRTDLRGLGESVRSANAELVKQNKLPFDVFDTNRLRSSCSV